jgi:probable O-glycosylation ligase (exosortase A-associated)
METITPTAYRTDSSGAKRMKSWYVAARLGIDHPLLGAGFHPFSPTVYQQYLPGYADDHDAHNHFLQVFAEHGLTGLLLFVALMVAVLLRLWRLARATRDDPQRQWIDTYAVMIGIGVIAFAAGGVFINMPYFDIYLELVAVTVVLQEIALCEGGNRCAPLGERLVIVALRRAGMALRLA